MRYISLIAFICFILFSACDGRVSRRESLKESVSKFMHSKQPLEIVAYVPTVYSEIETDTILNNGYKVNIKRFTNMNTAVLHYFTGKNINYKHFFRQINSEITVYKNDRLILQNVFRNEHLPKHVIKKFDFESYLNNGLHVNELASLESNTLVLETSYFKPKGDIKMMLRIIIDENGYCDFKRIDYVRT
ncbi:hypothetical protein [Hyunsoonleella jejuensis]|nr:hypothetical protein [Hyunsoonleella jejuensis]